MLADYDAWHWHLKRYPRAAEVDCVTRRRIEVILGS